MKRHLCATALFALALIPDWAGACWPPGGAPQPVYYVPAYCYHPPVYYAPACLPAAPTIVSPPPVAPSNEKAGGRVEPARPIAKPNPAPPKPPQIEQVRPAAGTDTKPPAPAPAPAPRVEVPPAAKPETAPAAVEPKREHAG